VAERSSTGIEELAELNDPRLRNIIREVRAFLRDYPELNRLTAGVDHSDRHILYAIYDTLSDFASTPPFIGQNLDYIISRNWTHILKRGVVAELCTSLMFLHMRNYLAYSDGGVNVQTENPQLLQAALQLLRNEYEQKKQRALIAANIDGALDQRGIHSELVFVNSFYGPW